MKGMVMPDHIHILVSVTSQDLCFKNDMGYGTGSYSDIRI